MTWNPKAEIVIPFWVYSLFGLRVSSPWVLPCPRLDEPNSLDLTLSQEATAPPLVTHQPKSPGEFVQVSSTDGSLSFAWWGQFHFLLSADGRCLACQKFNGVTQEEFLIHLLHPALSFALIRRRIEPFHASAVILDGGAVAFLGGNGFGKSTLTAAFLGRGYPMLADSLLAVCEKGGQIQAYPGPQWIKLFPEALNALLHEGVGGLSPLPRTTKLIVSLKPQMTVTTPAPLKAIFVIRAPRPDIKKITIRSLSPRRALIDLITATFNAAVRDPQRIKSQFMLAARLVADNPVWSLSYPRDLNRIPEVVEAVKGALAAKGMK